MMVFNTNVYVRHKYTDVWQRGTWAVPMKLSALWSQAKGVSLNQHKIIVFKQLNASAWVHFKNLFIEGYEII